MNLAPVRAPLGLDMGAVGRFAVCGQAIGCLTPPVNA